ncbi:hypothetical protein R1sor_025654 [Riccia sorocarpa]|uniref:phosphoribosylglycinamide formyltransferase 1 n=1 Tax=Riccia sorocarpa TaxID=122646 RepID=A0ABD3GAR7_9MARC
MGLNARAAAEVKMAATVSNHLWPTTRGAEGIPRISVGNSLHRGLALPTTYLRSESNCTFLRGTSRKAFTGSRLLTSSHRPGTRIRMLGEQKPSENFYRSCGVLPECGGDMRPGAVPRGNFTGDADEGFIRSKLAVFLSGGGSNFRALHASTLSNSIFGDIVVVVSDRPGCKGCDYARESNIPVLSYPLSPKHAPEGLSPTELVEALRKLEVDYILLAGFLKLLPAELVTAYPRSILNIHPALLPAFGGKGYFGMRVHEAVIKSGARFSGPTVHYVDEKYDTGPILAQRVVPVLADDSAIDLAARVLKEEHVLYPEVVAALCEDRIFWREDGVPIIRKSWDGPAEYY